jgi:hypothetical protein
LKFRYHKNNTFWPLRCFLVLSLQENRIGEKPRIYAAVDNVTPGRHAKEMLVANVGLGGAITKAVMAWGTSHYSANVLLTYAHEAHVGDSVRVRAIRHGVALALEKRNKPSSQAANNEYNGQHPA